MRVDGGRCRTLLGVQRPGTDRRRDDERAGNADAGVWWACVRLDQRWGVPRVRGYLDGGRILLGKQRERPIGCGDGPDVSGFRLRLPVRNVAGPRHGHDSGRSECRTRSRPRCSGAGGAVIGVAEDAPTGRSRPRAARAAEAMRTLAPLPIARRCTVGAATSLGSSVMIPPRGATFLARVAGQ